MYLRAEDGLGAGDTEVLDVLGGAEDRLLSREKYLNFSRQKMRSKVYLSKLFIKNCFGPFSCHSAVLAELKAPKINL